MTPTPESGGDPIDRSRYELIRAKHGLVPIVSVASKVRWCGLILLVAALAAPIVATLPDPVQQTYFSGDPTRTPLGAAAVVVLGEAFLTLAGVGLTALAVYRRRLTDISESQVWELVGAEDALTGFGFVTGALGTAAGIGLLATGFAGVDRIEWLIAHGITPYFPLAAYPTTPRVTTAVALFGALLTLALGASVAEE